MHTPSFKSIFLMNAIYYLWMYLIDSLIRFYSFHCCFSVKSACWTSRLYRSTASFHRAAPFEKSGRAKQRSQLYGADRAFFPCPRSNVPCAGAVWPWTLMGTGLATMATMGHATRRAAEKRLLYERKGCEWTWMQRSWLVSRHSLGRRGPWTGEAPGGRREARRVLQCERKREASWIFAE